MSLWQGELAARSVRPAVACLVCWELSLEHVHRVDIAERGSESFGGEARQGHQDEVWHDGALTGFEQWADLLWTVQQGDLDGGARLDD